MRISRAVATGRGGSGREAPDLSDTRLVVGVHLPSNAAGDSVHYGGIGRSSAMTTTTSLGRSAVTFGKNPQIAALRARRGWCAACEDAKDSGSFSNASPTALQAGGRRFETGWLHSTNTLHTRQFRHPRRLPAQTWVCFRDTPVAHRAARAARIASSAGICGESSSSSMTCPYVLNVSPAA